MGSITDLPGDIIVASKSGAPVQIKIIEAWQAERILGVRCALDGKDGAEFEYRLEAATSLAVRIAGAPLDRFDAEVVCRERWMATIKYCLPITRFSKEQCHKLAIVVEKALLPKLGFNRHMPKVVIYGPRQYGGKQIMNVHTEQLILHTEKFMAHIRGGDVIGDLQMILLNTQQLVSGAKDFMFQLPYDRYSYCEIIRLHL